MTIPFRPPVSQIPIFGHARRTAKVVMKHLSRTSLLVWVMRADDSVRLVKFNANGSWRFADQFNLKQNGASI